MSNWNENTGVPQPNPGQYPGQVPPAHNPSSGQMPPGSYPGFSGTQPQPGFQPAQYGAQPSQSGPAQPPSGLVPGGQQPLYVPPQVPYGTQPQYAAPQPPYGSQPGFGPASPYATPPKKSSTGATIVKVLSTVVTIIVAVVVISGVLSSMGRGSLPSKPPNPTYTPRSTDVEPSIPSGPIAMNDTLTVNTAFDGQIGFTIIDTAQTFTGFGTTEAQPGSVYVSVPVEVVNLGSQIYFHTNDTTVLVDTEGTTYEVDTAAMISVPVSDVGFNAFFLLTLSPDESKRGAFVYEVPQDKVAGAMLRLNVDNNPIDMIIGL